ncbi:MAG: hypothetical protein SWY16_07750 [Cyanobacteriota bacterium]|nr:hypothetical protein [Cyanobacteriota bacterium]
MITPNLPRNRSHQHSSRFFCAVGLATSNIFIDIVSQATPSGDRD